jgi:hypothetical protein
VGGLFSSFALELLVYPVVYRTWKWNTELRRQVDPAGAPLAGLAEAAAE